MKITQPQSQRLTSLLAHCKGLADELASQSMTGPDLLDCVGHLKMQYSCYESYESSLQRAIDSFVTASETQFSRCVEVYRQISVRVYNMLGDGDNGPPVALDDASATVDIDPACALSVVQAGPEPVRVTLYNDNATLAKLAPSQLMLLPNATADCEELEEYYDQEAQRAEAHELLYNQLQRQCEQFTVQTLQLQQQVARCSQALAQLGLSPLSNETVLVMGLRLDELMVALDEPAQRHTVQVTHCGRLVDIACAKFLECARHKEKLLNGYYTERARQRHQANLAPHF